MCQELEAILAHLVVSHVCEREQLAYRVNLPVDRVLLNRMIGEVERSIQRIGQARRNAMTLVMTHLDLAQPVPGSDQSNQRQSFSIVSNSIWTRRELDWKLRHLH